MVTMNRWPPGSEGHIGSNHRETQQLADAIQTCIGFANPGCSLSGLDMIPRVSCPHQTQMEKKSMFKLDIEQVADKL